MDSMFIIIIIIVIIVVVGVAAYKPDCHCRVHQPYPSISCSSPPPPPHHHHHHVMRRGSVNGLDMEDRTAKVIA